MKRVGDGLISLGINAEGEIRYITTVQQVVQLLKEGAEGKIVLVDDAGTTFLAPVLPKISGVVCRTGALGSHLAIVTREFEIPALMAVEIEDPMKLDGCKGRICHDEGVKGSLFIEERT